MEVTLRKLHHGSYLVELKHGSYLMESTPWKLPSLTYAMDVTSWNLHHGS